MIMDVVYFLLGFLLLVAGASVFVRGSSWLAEFLGVSPLVIGLTVVAYGTSSPEFLVSVVSSFHGQTEMALGNVVGSNIFNVLFILGVSASLVPLVVHRRLLQYDVPLVLFLSIGVYLAGRDGILDPWEGGGLVLLLCLYTPLAVVVSRREKGRVREPNLTEVTAPSPSRSATGILRATGAAVLGLALLVVGSNWFTWSASSFARRLGVSELTVGLTIVAAGTSTPEVATSVLAAAKGETDIAVGNIIGSNLFNLTGVLGCSVLVAPGSIPVSTPALEFDLPVLILVSFICLPIFFTGHRISRWEGGLFFLYYVLYVLSLISPQLHPFLSRSISRLFFVFLLPLTAVTLGIGVYRYATLLRGGREG